MYGEGEIGRRSGVNSVHTIDDTGHVPQVHPGCREHRLRINP